MLHKISFPHDEARESLKVAEIAPPGQSSITPGPYALVEPSPSSDLSLQWGHVPSSPRSQTQPLPHPVIVVIDDSATIRILLEKCLQREGFQVKSFGDGVEAMQRLFQPDIVPPALIILDIGLPKMDGYEVARRFKASPKFDETIIILLTRRDGNMDRLKCQLAGAKDSLTKPFTISQIVSVIETHLCRFPVHVQQQGPQTGP